MDRVILHSDLNNFFASVECLYNPAIREKPVAVCGDPEQRHGIVLAKNYHAKKFGIITGEPIWQAQRKCKDVILVPPNYDRYLHFSKLAHSIYADYTDKIQNFGIDECWLDVTGSVQLFGSGKTIADEIRRRMVQEVGITASIGVSFNKIFAKFGSDLRKPNFTTVITRENFKTLLWPLPVNELLYVGPATNKRLRNIGVTTIGMLAEMRPESLKGMLGLPGIILWRYANGMDTSEVLEHGEEPETKSIGNSTTTPRDLVSEEDAKIILYLLCESIAARMREQGFKAQTVQIWIRDTDLSSIQRQCKTEFPVCSAQELFDPAFALYKKNRGKKPLRSLGVRACDLVYDDYPQVSIWPAKIQADKHEQLDIAVESLRARFGFGSIQRGIMLRDKSLADLNPKEDHVVHPQAYLP